MSDEVLCAANLRPQELFRGRVDDVVHSLFWVDFLNGGAGAFECAHPNGASLNTLAKVSRQQLWDGHTLERGHGSAFPTVAVQARKRAAVAEIRSRLPDATALAVPRQVWPWSLELDRDVWLSCRGELGLVAPGAQATAGREGVRLVCDRVVEFPFDHSIRKRTIAVYSLFEAHQLAVGRGLSKAAAVSLSWILTHAAEGLAEHQWDLPGVLAAADCKDTLLSLIRTSAVREPLQAALDEVLALPFDAQGPHLGTPLRYPVELFADQLLAEALPVLGDWLGSVSFRIAKQNFHTELRLALASS